MNNIENTDRNQTQELETPENILKISREFVLAFYKTVSAEDKTWIKEALAKHMEQSNQVKYFAKFRVEFAKKFFPELCEKKHPSKASLLDALNEIDAENNEN